MTDRDAKPNAVERSRTAEPGHRHPVLLGLIIALIAFNLRPAVASIGPVLPEIRADLPLSGTAAAVLTLLPVLCFGLLAVAAPRLARRAGIEPVLLGVAVVVAVGLLVRVLDGAWLLFAGTAVVGGAIAIGNVLVPPLIKRDFPHHTGLMMGVYTMTVSGSAAVAASNPSAALRLERNARSASFSAPSALQTPTASS